MRLASLNNPHNLIFPIVLSIILQMAVEIIAKPKPEIAVIQTGGTIGSTRGESGSLQTSTTGEKVVSSNIEEIADELSVKIVSRTSPFNILSENMTPEDWQILARHIKEVLTPNLDGVVITHGTDTMEYTTNALSLSFPDIPFPMVTVGSMRDPEHPFSDAPYQLRDALFVAAYSDLRGVYAVMDSQVHKGTHVHKYNAGTDKIIDLQHFTSLNRLPIGYVVRAQRMEFHHLVASPYSPRTQYQDQTCYTDFASGESVAYCDLMPGMSIEYMQTALEQGAKIGILSLYTEGLGNATTKSLTELTAAAVKRAVPIFATVKDGGSVTLTEYSNALALRDKGMVPLFDMLNATACVKALWVQRSPSPTEDPQEIIRRMLTNYVGEFDSRISNDLIDRLCQPYSQVIQ